MDRPLRGGIVGCGFFGQIQLEAWRRMPEAEIVAACDMDAGRARESAPAAYTSAGEMLARMQKPEMGAPEASSRTQKGGTKILPLVRVSFEQTN